MINLEHIAKTLSFYHRNKHTIMSKAVAERLNKSLMTYDKELDAGVSYVKNKSELNVLNKL